MFFHRTDHRVLVNVHDRQRLLLLASLLFARIRAAMRLRTTTAGRGIAFAARVCGLWREKLITGVIGAQRVAMHNQYPATYSSSTFSSGNNVMPLSRAKLCRAENHGCHE